MDDSTNERPGGAMATRRGNSPILAGAALAAAVLAPLRASAQVDINPPLPDVLLLIDTSGSMEYMIAADASGKEVLPGAPGSPANSACVPGVVNPGQVLNRWASLVSVLTGTINNFSCQSVTRDPSFASEYKFYGANPYDLYYPLPFNRLLSNGCAIGPGTLD